MTCKLDIPARRKINPTSGSSNPCVEPVFCISLISIYGELNAAIKLRATRVARSLMTGSPIGFTVLALYEAWDGASARMLWVVEESWF